MTDAIISNEAASHTVRHEGGQGHVSPAGLKVLNPIKWLNIGHIPTEFNQITVFLFFFLFLAEVDLAVLFSQENTWFNRSARQFLLGTKYLPALQKNLSFSLFPPLANM